MTMFNTNLSRREMLKLGAAGVLTASFSGWLNALASHAAQTGQTPHKRCILLWMDGGPSHKDTFDLRPGTDNGGPFRAIDTSAAGIQISEHLPQFARLVNHAAIIRSMSTGEGAHARAKYNLHTGYREGVGGITYPSIGSIVAQQLERRATDVPLYVGNTKFYGGGPGYLGPAYAPFMPSPNPLTSTGANTYDPVPLYLTEETQANLSLTADGAMTLRRRHGLVQALDSLAHDLDDSDTAALFDRHQRRAVELLAGPRTRAAFDLSREDPRTRDRYGDTDWGKSLLTARRLVEAGVRFVQCQATFRLRPETGRTSTWDDHSVNVDIFEAYRERMPVFDQAVSAIIEDLGLRGLDRHVLFLFCGEFGRTPRIENQDVSRRPGRDHWPRAMSVLAAGGGLRMGQVIGATDARGSDPSQRAMNSNCLLATIYHRFGIDTHQMLHDRTGRPIPILAEGEPIAELI
jgi:hypothetical protein